jgi:hypothetical protein
MTPDKERKRLAWLVRLHFGYLVAVPLLGMVSWWFLGRSQLPAMIISGFAAIAAYYAILAEGYHLTAHFPSALWAVFSSPAMLVVSSLLGGGFWYFYLDAAFIEVGGMCVGLIAGVTGQIKYKDYFPVVVLYLFMGAFLVFWGLGIYRAHSVFPWYDNIWLVMAFGNEAYGYSRMFVAGRTSLEFGHGRAAREAGARLLPTPLKDDGTGLLMAFGVLIVLSPFVFGLLNYLLK